LEEADQLCQRIAIIDGGLIVREGTPEQLKKELRERRGLAAEPTLGEVFLDATGRTRERIAGEVEEVSPGVLSSRPPSWAVGPYARPGGHRRHWLPRSSSRCSS